MPIKQARLKISDYNEKRKTRLRSQEKRVGMVSLSLTSMVDMFAILVIFLLANSSTLADWVKVGHGINLPHAKSQDIPTRAATVQIAADSVFGEDKALEPTQQLWKTVEPLKNWLKTIEKKDGYINIVGHEKLPFGLVKRVVAACQDAGFHNVNLAVQPRAVQNQMQ